MFTADFFELNNKMVSPSALGVFALTLVMLNGKVGAQVYQDDSGEYFLIKKDDGKSIKAYLESSKSGGVRPRTSEADDVFFLLYTKKNPLLPERIRVSDTCLSDYSNYCRGGPLKIIVHGFTDSAEDGPAKILKSAYLSCYDGNVIAVDWSTLAQAPWYNVACDNTQYVGYRIAELISYLVRCGLVTLNDVHIIGHSLGAHVAGYAGKYIKSMYYGAKVGRITPLDPAGPLWEDKDANNRVDFEDAHFVDVYHTASKSILEGGLSLKKCVGHADFFPNGGYDQPGCALDVMSSCSHGRCVSLLAESICHPTKFRACKCDCWEDYQHGLCPCTDSQYMGEHVSHNASGSYYLCTNGDSPYSYE